MKPETGHVYEKPKFIGLTKFLFYCAFIAIVCQAVFALVHTFYFAFPRHQRYPLRIQETLIILKGLPDFII